MKKMLVLGFFLTFSLIASVPRTEFSSPSAYLVIEALNDNVFHFEVAAGKSPGTKKPLWVSPMVSKQPDTYSGPAQFNRSSDSVETTGYRIDVSKTDLCFSIYDKSKHTALTTFCPEKVNDDWKGMSFDSGFMTNVYGLGQYMTNVRTADGDWLSRPAGSRVWEPGPYGNVMEHHGELGGSPGKVMFPVIFAIGNRNDETLYYAFFLDNHYRQRWDFSKKHSKWRVDMYGDQMRGFFLVGKNFMDLRHQFMELVGRPQIPPKSIFGLWMSEFGYESWGEMGGILSLLRKERFPIDGFALDLQWYGGEFFFTDDGWKVNEGRRRGRMGTLGFDERAGRFDRAADTIRRLKEKEGLELMLIEQSYIGANLDKERAKKEKDLVCWNDNAHAEMANRGFLIRQRSADGPPVYLTGNPWWGQGSMIDWLIPEAGDFWHDMKRKPLLALGIRSHWPDLGEPEMFDPGDWSRGIEPGKHEHQDYHNLYAFKWYESIARGYSRHQEKRRHYIMGRSGTVGIQRFGVGMWSGDIGARIANLTAGVNSRVLHMPFSGMDYLSSDIGGFHRWSLDSSLKSLYTQWFATACLLEFPVRPHVWNLSNEPSKHNDPVRVGHLASNLSNLRRRYELVPYYYSLAHKAYLYGDPVVAPLVYYFGEDTHLRHIGEEAMVGPDLLAATMANGERWEYEKKVYLPKGTWVEYNGHDYFRSNGGWTSELPAYRNGTVTLPLFARSGAIIPKAKVDEQTMNVFGKRLDGSVANDWIVRVFADEKETRFTLFEDDGDTVQYRDSEPKVRTTVLTQKKDGNHAQLTIDGSRGSYTGAPEKRPVTVELVAENAQAESVSLKAASRSRSLAQCPSQKAFEMAEECFFNAGNNLVVAKIKPEKATEPKTFDFHLESQPRASVFFICNNATTAPGESIYVSGDIRELGQWNPSQALRLGPDPYTPQATLTWAGVVTDLPIRTPFQWKCLKRVEEQGGQVLQWQPGENYTFSTRQGFSGKAVGGF